MILKVFYNVAPVQFVQSRCLQASPCPELPLASMRMQGGCQLLTHKHLVAFEVPGVVKNLCFADKMCLQALMEHTWDTHNCLSISCGVVERGPLVTSDYTHSLGHLNVS